MRRLAHISDLHFGAHEPAAVAALADALRAIRPDLVIVSGDLSQRARREQFAAADVFLGELEAAGLPLLVVPGNHDVPWHRPAARLFRPLGRYRRMVQRERPCVFVDAEVAVLGLSSAHGLTVKDGRLTRRQIRLILSTFAAAPAGALRVLVTHHPLVPLPGEEEGVLEPALRGATRTLAAVRAADVRVVLAGHHHAHSVTLTGATVATDPHVLVVQAGTATSWRRRGSPNSFNLLEVADDRLRIVEWSADGGPFAPGAVSTYAGACRAGWRAAPA